MVDQRSEVWNISSLDNEQRKERI